MMSAFYKPKVSHLPFLSNFSWPRVLTILFVCVAALALRASADSAAPPRDYLQLTKGGQYEFVMLPKVRFARKNPQLRKRYSRSGLYRKGAPQHPLWTVDWYAFTVYPSSDGRHLVRMGPWASEAEELAVAFYNDGHLLREFKISQLVQDPQSLPHSVSHFMWLKAISFNDAKRLLRIMTLGGEKYLFDADGQLVEGKLVPPYQPKNQADALLHKGDIQGLVRLGTGAGAGAGALPEVVDAVRGGTGQKQQVAFVALCANGKAALPDIERLSQDPQAGVRVMAANALKEISIPEGRPLLEAMLQDKEPSVRIAAIEGLVQLHEETGGTPAIEATQSILHSGSDAEKRDLLFALQRYRLPVLVPGVLLLLDNQSHKGEDRLFGVAARARYFLRSATFQDFEFLDVGSDGPRKMAGAWKSWWKTNKQLTSDEWFVQAVERDLTALKTEESQKALNHLQTLTGQSFGAYEARVDAKAIAQWSSWWRSHKGQRPGQILIGSLAAKTKGTESYTEGWYQLPEQTDKRDVADLVALYAAADEYHREYVEAALRRITNIDSFAVPMLRHDKEQAVIEAWKKFAA